MLIKILFYTLLEVLFRPAFLLSQTVGFWVTWQISKVLGFLIYHSPIRKITENNLRKIYKIEDTQILVKKYIYKIARYICEIINLNKMNATGTAILKINNFQILTQCLEQNKGCLALVMHAGNWELFGSVLAHRLPTNAIVNSPKNSFFLEYLDNCRKHNHVKLINIQTENMYRGCLKALKNNEIVLIAADTGATDSDKHILAPFLGELLPVASGWATLAKKTDTLVVPTFTHNTGGYHHETIVGEPLDPTLYKSEEELILAALKFYENNLKKYPDEWFLPLSDSEVKKTFK